MRASAAVFSALARKQSFLREASIYPEFVGLAENYKEISKDNIWIKRPFFDLLIRFSAFLSLLSVCINTPVTASHYPFLLYLTFSIDIFCCLIFTLELVHLMIINKKCECFKDKWFRFNLIMVLFLWISLALQIMEIFKLVHIGTPWSILRCPRPLIIIRMFSSLLKFQLPKNRINQIFKRSSQQVYNVTLFFLFFMSLYAMNGVQFFGQIKHHCVTNNTIDNKNLSINSFSIPHSYCSKDPNYGYHCPKGMKCVELNLPWGFGGFDGFNNFFNSFFTVYESGSQEGWVFIMYKMIDSLPAWRAILYFITLIFFLAWLVKNVFIAVITETFAEIRVQFQQMWGFRASSRDASVDQHIITVDHKWKLVRNGTDRNQGFSPQFFRDVLHTTYFNMCIILLIIVDAIIAAGILDQTRLFKYPKNRYFAQVVATLIFDLEAIYKIWCVGITGYFKRSIYKFEFILALGSSIHIFPLFYHSQLFTVFQAIRIVRLIKASPLLENFVHKIFGPGKKLGSLILFTVCLLILTSSISLQLFCYIDIKQFSTFPYAFMSMFQIITQEGWVELMDDTMWKVGQTFAPLVAIYFTFYHLFVTLIVLSLFVAVILDNLELEEDMKKMKQLKQSEQTAGKEALLPWRLRIFDYFSPHPQLIRLHKDISDFLIPKLRESFLRRFIMDNSDISILLNSTPEIYFQSMLSNVIPKRLQNPTGHRTKRKEEKLLGEEVSSSPFKVMTNEGVLSSQNLFLNQAKNKRYPQSLRKPFYCSEQIFMPIKNSTFLEAYICKNEFLRNSLIEFLNSQLKENTLNTAPDSLNLAKPVSKAGSFNFGPFPILKPNSRGFIKQKTKSEYSNIDTLRFASLNAHQDINNKKLNQTSFRNGEEPSFDIKAFQHRKQQAEMKRYIKEDDLRENHPFFDTPLLIIGRDSFLRKVLQKLVYSRFTYNPAQAIIRWNLKCVNAGLSEKIFKLLGMNTYLDWIMIMVTSLSCISLILETPEHRIMNTKYLRICDYIFVVAMTIELCLKILCNGLIFTPKAYLKDFGGFLDLFIYMVNIILLILMPGKIAQGSKLQLLMVFRAFRPLRIFVLLPHIRKVIKELCRGFKEIFLVSILLIVSLFIFASYGVQLYGGKLVRCNDPKILLRSKCVGTFMREVFVTRMKFPATAINSQPKILVPRVWSNPRNFNFDNVQKAMLALFEILSFKGWTDIRDTLINQVGPTHAIYVHIFVFMACMIGLTLFVGVVIANYMESKGTALLTVDQRRWCDLKARLKIAQPLFLPQRPSNSKIRGLFYDITQHKCCKRFYVCLIILSSSLLSVKWKKNTKYSLYLAIASAVFIFLFVIEIVMKIGALSFPGFWQSKRNRYDFVVTILSVLWVILFFSFNTDIFFYMGYFVIILRFFSLVGKHPILQMLMLTVVMSFFKSFFIITAMLLLIITYALIGVILFGTVKYGENLGRQANFHTAPNAMIVLFRIVTGEDWNKILHDTMIKPPYCTLAENYWETDCGNPTAALIYFCSFYIIITYIVLNLLVAIIMENFSLFYSNEEDALISHTDIRNFQMIWNIVDVNQKGWIPKRRVKFLLRLLKGRLQVDLEKEKTLFQHMCYEIEKLNASEEISFHDVLSVLAYRSVDIQKSLQIEELLEREELEYIIREEVAKQTIRNWLEKCLAKKRGKNKSDIISSLRANQEPLIVENFNKLAYSRDSSHAYDQVILTEADNQKFAWDLSLKIAFKYYDPLFDDMKCLPFSILNNFDENKPLPQTRKLDFKSKGSLFKTSMQDKSLDAPDKPNIYTNRISSDTYDFECWRKTCLASEPKTEQNSQNFPYLLRKNISI